MLIENVLENKQQIIVVAKKLRIKLSTAKHILKLYRKEGRIFQKMTSKTSKRPEMI